MYVKGHVWPSVHVFHFKNYIPDSEEIFGGNAIHWKLPTLKSVANSVEGTCIYVQYLNRSPLCSTRLRYGDFCSHRTLKITTCVTVWWWRTLRDVLENMALKVAILVNMYQEGIRFYWEKAWPHFLDTQFSNDVHVKFVYGRCFSSCGQKPYFCLRQNGGLPDVYHLSIGCFVDLLDSHGNTTSWSYTKVKEGEVVPLFN